MQTVDGRVLRRRRNDLGPPLSQLLFEPVDAVIDLHREFDQLRSAPPLVRPDHRIARIELRIGGKQLAMDYPRPLIGDAPTDHPADRLYAALWDWPTE